MAENWSLGSPQDRLEMDEVSKLGTSVAFLQGSASFWLRFGEVWQLDLLGRLPHSFAANHTFGRMCMRAQRDFLWGNSGINWLGIPSGHVQEGTLVVLFLVLNFETVYVASATRAAIHTLGSSEGAWRIPTSVYLKMRYTPKMAFVEWGKLWLASGFRGLFPTFHTRPLQNVTLWLG
jgi:hypothetical protein